MKKTSVIKIMQVLREHISKHVKKGNFDTFIQKELYSFTIVVYE